MSTPETVLLRAMEELLQAVYEQALNGDVQNLLYRVRAAREDLEQGRRGKYDVLEEVTSAVQAFVKVAG
jgi:hypothetical protein